MRLFTAIDIPGEVKARLGALINRLRPTANLRRSPVENLHVTIKFIGEWPEARLGEVKKALASVRSVGPVGIEIGGLSWFPSPRIFSAGIEASAELRQLARDTDEALARVGVAAEERGFHPHLTLARSKLRPRDCLFESVSGDKIGTFRAESFFLYLSAGGKYTKLEEFPLSPV